MFSKANRKTNSLEEQRFIVINTKIEWINQLEPILAEKR
jgi:hypothetical protein